MIESKQMICNSLSCYKIMMVCHHFVTKVEELLYYSVGPDMNLDKMQDSLVITFGTSENSSDITMQPISIHTETDNVTTMDPDTNISLVQSNEQST